MNSSNTSYISTELLAGRTTFSEAMLAIAPYADLNNFFDDLLSVILLSFSRTLGDDQSVSFALGIPILAKYENRMDVAIFSMLAELLISEMKAAAYRVDVLGTFFEEHLAAQNQVFPLPSYAAAEANAASLIQSGGPDKHTVDLRCGSGRTLMAVASQTGYRHSYYGADTNLLCVKMAAINLFLAGVRSGEVICIDWQNGGRFQSGYRFSEHTQGVSAIRLQERSLLWQQLRQMSRMDMPPVS